MDTDESKVRHLLEMAGMSLGPDEVDEFAAAYAVYRAEVDALYAFELPHGEEPQTIFSPVIPLESTHAQEGA